QRDGQAVRRQHDGEGQHRVGSLAERAIEVGGPTHGRDGEGAERALQLALKGALLEGDVKEDQQPGGRSPRGGRSRLVAHGTPAQSAGSRGRLSTFLDGLYLVSGDRCSDPLSVLWRSSPRGSSPRAFFSARAPRAGRAEPSRSSRSTT